MMTMLKHKKRHTPHFWHVCSCEQTKTTRAHQIATHVEQIKKDNVNTRMFTVTALSPPQHPYHNQVPGTIWYLARSGTWHDLALYMEIIYGKYIWEWVTEP
jgi:hypothetical protein